MGTSGLYSDVCEEGDVNKVHLWPGHRAQAIAAPTREVLCPVNPDVRSRVITSTFKGINPESWH